MGRYRIADKALNSLVISALLSGMAGSFDRAHGQEDSVSDRFVANSVSQLRLSRQGMKAAIMGGLLRLDDTQIRQRWGLADPRYDACSGDGCAPLTPGTGQALPLPMPFTQNRKGEWANFINIFPDGFRWPGGRHESAVQIQDSNMFVTAAIAYPLFMFDESELPAEERVISQVRSLAVDSIRQYQRGAGFSFWPTLPGSTSTASRVGPLNIPMAAGNGMQLMKLFPRKKPTGNPIHAEWNEDVTDREKNPYGLDALANIPNDVDDTSVGFVSLQLAAQFDGAAIPSDDPVLAMLEWRDWARTMDDGRDAWRGRNSGAFLTWMKDESLPRDERFKSPETGVIPLAVNNVDCVVNANALLALALSGRAESANVQDVSRVMRRAVEQYAWPECGLYYPQRMMFPYALSRAARDGGIHNSDIATAIGKLLVQLLDEQSQLAKEHPELKGAFSGGADHTYDLATALGLTTLLNIGRGVAEAQGLVQAYDKAVDDAVAFLLARQKPAHIGFVSTFNRGNQHPFYPSPLDFGRSWESGLFFSASKWNLAQWRSPAYTTAMGLEALGKYVSGYELTSRNIHDGVRLKVKSYARNADKAGTDFELAPTE